MISRIDMQASLSLFEGDVRDDMGDRHIEFGKEAWPDNQCNPIRHSTVFSYFPSGLEVFVKQDQGKNKGTWPAHHFQVPLTMDTCLSLKELHYCPAFLFATAVELAGRRRLPFFSGMNNGLVAWSSASLRCCNFRGQDFPSTIITCGAWSRRTADMTPGYAAPASVLLMLDF
jgi:hypothetical protein